MSRQAQCKTFLLALAFLLPSLAAAQSLFPEIDEFDIPDRMTLSAVGTRMRINGIATQVYRFESSLTRNQLAAHFRKQWPGRTRRAWAGPWDVLSHRQGSHLLTVQMTDAGASQSRGLISASNSLDAFSRKSSQRPPGFPLPRRTQILQDIESIDLGRKSRTLILVSKQSALRNLEWFRNHFRAQGFVPISKSSLRRNHEGGALTLGRNGEQLNLAAAQGREMTVITIVQVTP